MRTPHEHGKRASITDTRKDRVVQIRLHDGSNAWPTRMWQLIFREDSAHASKEFAVHYFDGSIRSRAIRQREMMSVIRLLLEQAHYLVLEVCSAVRHPLFGYSVVGEPVDEDVGDRFSGCVLGWREPDITTVVVLQYEDVEVVVFSW